MQMFHYGLRPGGYLFLGNSELPEGAMDLFLAFDKNAHIFEAVPSDHADAPGAEGDGHRPAPDAAADSEPAAAQRRSALER